MIKISASLRTLYDATRRAGTRLALTLSMQSIRTIILSITAIAAMGAAATAQISPDPLAIRPQDATAVFSYNGTTIGQPVWQRPLANGNNPPTGLSGTGTAVPWSAISFSVTVTGSYVFQSVATAPANWDNYTFLYVNSFNPAQPLTNVLIGNDDNPTIGLSGFTINLTAGTNYSFVTTGFSNTSSGAFSNTISGPGDVIAAGQAVPEGGAGLVILAITAGGLLVAGTRLRKVAPVSIS